MEKFKYLRYTSLNFEKKKMDAGMVAPVEILNFSWSQFE